jgi:hypothetical protein
LRISTRIFFLFAIRFNRLASLSPPSKEYLGKYARSKVRVVSVKMDLSLKGQQTTSFTMGLFVRVNGARARIFGIGNPEISQPK